MIQDAKLAISALHAVLHFFIQLPFTWDTGCVGQKLGKKALILREV